MLTGAADLDTMANGAPALTAFATEALPCPSAEVFQVIYEIRSTGREALFPPGLHPVNPATLTWSFLRAPQSDVGPFTLAQTRLVCRSGVRGRGFRVSAFVDNDATAELL